MSRQYFLAHDVGTTATKTSIVSADGRIVDSEARAHGTATPGPGCAEQNPEDWWSGVCQNTEAVLGRHTDARDRIAAIGVSGHMLGCVAVDRDGEPVRPAMIHSDTRSGRQYERVEREVGAEQLYQISGNILDPRSPLCKLLWLKDNEPSNYESTARFMQSKDFIVGRMVGRFESTDYSDACHAQWMDIRHRNYAEDVFGTLGLDVGKLPQLHAATDVVGTLCADAASALGLPDGIPVVAGGGDGSCATAGAGAVQPGAAYCCIGSTAWIACTLEEPLLDARRRVFNLVSLDGERCAVYGTVQSAGRSLDWVMDLLEEAGFERFEDLLEEASAGSDGLIFLPYLEGERSPIYDADARGVFFGITPAHGRCHFLRATVEGVSYALRSVLEVLRESGDVPALRLIGGGGQSETWQQILADVCDVRMQLLSTRAADATSLGAALAAAVGIDAFPSMSEAVRSVTVEQEREPDPAARRVYARLFEVYNALYPRLKPVFGRLQVALEGVLRGDDDPQNE